MQTQCDDQAGSSLQRLMDMKDPLMQDYKLFCVAVEMYKEHLYERFRSFRQSKPPRQNDSEPSAAMDLEFNSFLSHIRESVEQVSQKRPTVEIKNHELADQLMHQAQSSMSDVVRDSQKTQGDMNEKKKSKGLCWDANGNPKISYYLSKQYGGDDNVHKILMSLQDDGESYWDERELTTKKICTALKKYKLQLLTWHKEKAAKNQGGTVKGIKAENSSHEVPKMQPVGIFATTRGNEPDHSFTHQQEAERLEQFMQGW